MNKKKRISDGELPALFRAADNASRQAQAWYFTLVAADLAMLVLSAGLTTIPTREPSAWHAIAGAVLLLIGLCVTLALWWSDPDTVWYGARAAAESCKTLAWRYCMGAEPYALAGDHALADQRLLSDLKDILAQRKQLSWRFGGELATEPQISGTMRDVRGLDFRDRLKIYLDDRITDQQQWYALRSRSNRRKKTAWFAAFFLAQLAAFIFAVGGIIHPGWEAYSSAAAALSSAFLAWSQANKFQELAQAYAVTAHELGLTRETAAHVKSDQDLAQFVSDSERAISREHTLWVARRDR